MYLSDSFSFGSYNAEYNFIPSALFRNRNIRASKVKTRERLPEPLQEDLELSVVIRKVGYTQLFILSLL